MAKKKTKDQAQAESQAAVESLSCEAIGVDLLIDIRGRE
ncbi:hypothetical protein ES703_120452 [subsurface metagenome]